MRRLVSLAVRLACGVASAAAITTAKAQPSGGDLCDSADGWRVITSDGVEADVRVVDEEGGKALRLDFDFRSGAGFCVIRHDLSQRLPENYQFSFAVRGDARPNNLEFKLVDVTGENVWWVNRRSFEFPSKWQTIVYKRRHFRFAWGPSGGKPLDQLGAIEIAVAAAGGGKGSVYFDKLAFAPLPALQPPTQTPVLHVSSSRGEQGAAALPLDAAGRVDWHSTESDTTPTLRLDLQQLRDFGGLALEWQAGDHATAYEIALSGDGENWAAAAAIEGGTGGRDYVPLPDGQARHIRLRVLGASGRSGVGLRGLRLLPADFADSPNTMYRTIAGDAPRGWFPRYFLNEQQPWTVVGVAGDEKEALLDAAGAIEVDKLAFRLEPFLLTDGKLITWADAALGQSLADDYVPIPSVKWRAGDLVLDITAVADGSPGQSRLLARYIVRNDGAQPKKGSLFVGVRPFQVLPPWQDLNITGGVARIGAIAWDGQRITVDDDRTVRPWTQPDGFGAASFVQGDVVEQLARGNLPAQKGVKDADRLASAALRFDFDLKPGEQRIVVIESPFYGDDRPAKVPDAATQDDGAVAARFAEAYEQQRAAWRRELNRVELALPGDGARLANTFRSMQGYVLINADGPAIQPGSRTYERSWIRDGALTSTALLYTGHTAQVRAYLDWYAGFQFPNGKVPCVVDRRGPDPVPEHDSTGELIYALLQYYRFTKDRAFLERHLPQIEAGVKYLDALRAERLTPSYRDGPPEMQACYGLVPESISHEGYSAKPMHSYWDSFFTLRGLKDAATIAQLLDRPELEKRFAASRDAYRTALYDSLRLAMRLKQINYIPGCVELGDFDATSTTIALFPCGEQYALPQPALGNTFDRYYDFFRKRRDGLEEWTAYTPYELRVVGSFVRLGQPERAHELLEFFFRDQRPAGWNHWAEVVHRDPAAPQFVGDMPHTWVGSDFLSAARSMFVYEEERDDSLVLAAGVKPEWLAGDGVRITNFPTEFGLLSYTLRRDGQRIVMELDGSFDLPPGGLRLRNPDARAIRTAEVDGAVVEGVGERSVQFRARRGRIVLNLAD